MAILASDTFNRPNGSLGPNWTDAPGGTFGIASNAATALSVVTGLHCTAYNAVSPPANQWAQVKILSLTATYNGPAVRVASGAQTGYMLGIDITGVVYLVKELAGTQSNLATSAAATVAANDILKLQVVGTSLTAYVNDVLVPDLSFTDSDIATGLFGLGGYNGGSMDNWLAGNFTAPVPGTSTPATGVPGDTIANFTVTGTNFDSTGGGVTNANGYDIIFTSDAAGASALAYDRETYTNDGVVNLWVNIPTVSHTADTVFYLFYGKSSVSTDQSNPTGTWDSNYKGVWHFPNGLTLSLDDSTSNANTAVKGSGVTAIAGKVDGGVNFFGTENNTNEVDLSGPVNTSMSSYTFEWWLKRAASQTTGYGTFAARNDSGEVAQYFLVESDGTLHNWGWFAATTTIDTNWHHVVYTYDGTTARFYVDGAAAGTSVTAATWGTHDWKMGLNGTGGHPYVGSLDEQRFSNVVRTADWIATEYNNQSSPSTFYSIGAETTNPAGGAWANGYTYRRTITIDHTKVPNTNQSNFPMLFSGTYSYLALNSGSGSTLSFSGAGITVNSYSVQNATKIVANITIAGGAATTARNVVVTNPSDSQTGTLTGAFTILAPAATPTFSPIAGSYAGTQNVVIASTTPSNTIYYTTDGTTPTTGSTVYNGPVAVAVDTTLKAIATASGFSTSAVGSAAYVITTPVPSVYSVPDCRKYGTFPNNSRNVQGTLTYDVGAQPSHTDPVDSRTAGAPTDSRQAANKPQNSRNQPPF